MSNDSKRLLAFGAFELDRDEGLLFRAGELVPLPPKALQTLLVLVESGGRLLTKDELMQAIWADTFVEEHNLTLNIHILRKALNPNGGADRYIETVPRRGYRFIAPVRETTRAPRGLTVDPPPPAVESRRAGVAWVAAIIAAVALVAGTIAASRLLARRTDLDAGPEVLRLTNNIADDRQPDVSPDGRRIVFVTNRDGGKGEIYVMDADGGNPRDLTQNPANDDTPAWSPDGRRIAFQSDRRGPIELFVMDADGSVQHRVDPESSEGGWWPGGRAIVFESDRDGNTELYRRRLDHEPDGAARLTHHVATDDHPAWSRDGRWIAFDSNRDGKPNIFVTDPDGGRIRNVTRGGASDVQPAWSSDSGSIAFAC